MGLEVVRIRLAIINQRALLAGRALPIGERRFPPAAIPVPCDAFGRQRVTNGLRDLRRDRKTGTFRPPRGGARQIAAGRGRNAARLEWWLRGVHDVAVGRYRATARTDDADRTVARRRRIGPSGERAVRVEPDPHAVWCILELGRAGANQPLMIEERPAKRAHEEVVSERVLLGPLP